MSLAHRSSQQSKGGDLEAGIGEQKVTRRDTDKATTDCDQQEGRLGTVVGFRSLPSVEGGHQNANRQQQDSPRLVIGIDRQPRQPAGGTSAPHGQGRRQGQQKTDESRVRKTTALPSGPHPGIQCSQHEDQQQQQHFGQQRMAHGASSGSSTGCSSVGWCVASVGRGA